MFVVGLLSWWYSEGWARRFKNLSEQIAKAYDYFSIDLLTKTLFSPFRQISAGGVSGPMSVRMRAFFDNLISRFIGAFMRIIMIVVGVLWIMIVSIIGFLRLVIWPFIPVLPMLGLMMVFTGWIPWQI